MSQTNINTDECWLWGGPKAMNGYGVMTVPYHKWYVLAHRAVYEALKGPIPKGLQIDHLCKVTICVNPEHLEAVTPAVNTYRSNAVSALNRRKTHCLNGHAFTADNLYVPPKRPNRRYCRTCQTAREQAYKARLKTRLYSASRTSAAVAAE